MQQLRLLSSDSQKHMFNSRDVASSSSSSPPPRSSLVRTSAVALVSLAVGLSLGKSFQEHRHEHEHPHRVLPNGIPRTCCDKEKPDAPTYKLTKDQEELSKKLSKIVGKDNIIDGQTESTRTLPFLKGARLGQGRALCILTPQRLQDVVDAVKLIVDADCVLLPQGQNTGLTGGSVPANDQNGDTRPVVVISFRYLNRMFPLDKGERIVCLAGSGLASLHQFLEQEFPDREPHSVLGSTFLNPTTAAGVAFGSGGTQLRKGPAYSDRALYLTVSETKWGERQVHVVNTLGIEGLENYVERRQLDSVSNLVDRWSRLVNGGYDRTMRYSSKEGKARWAHDVTYGRRLCDSTSPLNADDSNDISRFNADTRGSFPNRSEGKVVILATVHDTFPKPRATKTFWISFDSLDTALAFRRQVCLQDPEDLPISLEYMDKDAFDVIDQAGRVLSSSICLVGTTSSILRHLWNVKLWVEALPFERANLWVDRVLFFVNPLIPSSLPPPIMKMSHQLGHHVSMTIGEFGGGELDRLQKRMEDFLKTRGEETIQVYECKTSREKHSLSAFRFAAAPAFRTFCVGNGLQGVSVDYALPKTKGQVPVLSVTNNSESSQDEVPVKRMRYSHFGCNVVHEDLAYGTDVDVHNAKYSLKRVVEHMGGKMPSEHGHGREYVAPPETQARWIEMDPLNVCNPGIGGLSNRRRYQNE